MATASVLFTTVLVKYRAFFDNEAMHVILCVSLVISNKNVPHTDIASLFIIFLSGGQVEGQVRVRRSGFKGLNYLLAKILFVSFMIHGAFKG